MSTTDSAAELERQVQEQVGRLESKHAADRDDAATAAGQQTGGQE
ncbi:hypothetical protein [Kitasatospora sp. NPDC098663]